MAAPLYVGHTHPTMKTHARGKSATSTRRRSQRKDVVVVRCDFDKAPLLDNFVLRRWAVELRPAALDDHGRLSFFDTQCGGEVSADWILWWASTQIVRAISASLNEFRLQPHQRINHFYTHTELTRKDRMYAHTVRYCKSQAAQHRLLSSADPNRTPRQQPGTTIASRSGESALTSRGPVECLRDFVPPTFGLPHEFAMLRDAGRTEGPESLWIVKPANNSQGKGIFIVRDINAIPMSLRNRSAARIEPHVVSRYVDRPLLVEGRKFDLRIYVLVLSFAPLRAFRHEAAFARFCSVPYPCQQDGSRGVASEDLVAHLTNTSYQKQQQVSPSIYPSVLTGCTSSSLAAAYQHIVVGEWQSHGGKWSWENVLLHIATRYGSAAMRTVLSRVDFVLSESLRAVQEVMRNDPHCFELLGYDILIDEALRPWLLEVNASPSLSPSTPSDLALKRAVISDTLNMVIDQKNPYEPLSVLRRRPLSQLPLGGFTCIVDEMTPS